MGESSINLWSFWFEQLQIDSENFALHDFLNGLRGNPLVKNTFKYFYILMINTVYKPLKNQFLIFNGLRRKPLVKNIFKCFYFIMIYTVNR